MSIRLRYIIAISVIAIAISIYAASVSYVIDTQKDDASIINIAGQQRMLSQRIALFVHQAVKCDSSSEQYIAALKNSAERFEKNHRYLTSIPKLPSAVSELYFGKTNVNKDAIEYISEANAFADNPLCEQVSDAFKIANTDPLLQHLNDIVLKFEESAEKRVHTVIQIEIYLYVTTLLILLLEVFFIFRPMERKISTTISALNEALEKAKNAEADAKNANKAKSEFLASMSHELRTPMNGLFGMIELALDNPNKSDDYLKKAKTAGRQLLTLINDVLDLSKIEAGKLRIDNHSFDLLQMIDDTVSLHAVICSKKELNFSYHTETNLPTTIIADPTRISQVLHNLLSNAIKFTLEGSVTLNVRVMVENRRHWLVFEVIDTGVGISEEKQKNVFNQFEQADQTTTRLFGGTGLGLSISAQLAELMEGNISLASENGKGSTFTFKVPIKVDKRTYPALPNTGLKCAIVDDLQTSREYLEHLLTNLGLEPIAYDSAEVFLADKPEQFDILLIDLSMPVLDGVGTIEALLNKNLFELPYIIVVSAVLEHLDCTEGVRKAIWRTHTKPLDRQALENDLREIQAIFAKQNAVSESDDSTTKRILVVEDNTINAEVIKAMLEQKQYHVSLAFDGQAAIDCCLEQNFDLIIMDLQMPILDGLEATKRLRVEHGLKTPIVALTANTFAEDREQSFAVGMDAFLTKPINKLKLYSIIDKHTKGSINA